MTELTRPTFYSFLSAAFVRLRVLQVLMVCAVLLVTVRLERLYHISDSIFVHSAKAEKKTEEASPPKKDEPPAHAPEPAKSQAPLKHETKEASSEPKKEGGFTAENFDILDLSGEQVEVLRSLSKRHKDLIERERSIAEREATIQAVEKRLDAKTEELKKIQDYLKQLLGEKDEKEKEAIKKLVLVYQKMKPQEAATILQELDLETLLNIMDEMKDTNVSSILSKMEPLRARFLTQEIAQRRKKLEDKMQKEQNSNEEVAKLTPVKSAAQAPVAPPQKAVEQTAHAPTSEPEPAVASNGVVDTVKSIKPVAAKEATPPASKIPVPEKPSVPDANAADSKKKGGH